MIIQLNRSKYKYVRSIRKVHVKTKKHYFGMENTNYVLCNYSGNNLEEWHIDVTEQEICKKCWRIMRLEECEQ